MSARNILFIMADQLRADYLSCYGHKSLHTPNLDLLASQGVKFTRAYTQSTVCGPSRMSFYTGRYVSSHGATWNDTPLPIGEMGLGDHLEPLGVRTLLVGKTHMRPDAPGMARLGISRDGDIGRRVTECGFEAFLREEGIYLATGDQTRHLAAHYNRWLADHGYSGDNPWHNWVNSVEVGGEIISGWYLDASAHPVRAAAEHTETPYLTQQGLRCLDTIGDQPWCMHLSYIKPHWPYVAPAPYHGLYPAADIQAPQRSEAERDASAHPVMRAFQDLRVSRAFASDAVREVVVPAYMGLIKQLDDAVGEIIEGLRERQLLDQTMIVFTSDHGDYMGDHWLGEKDFLHEPSARIPLIIVDPSREADATRGTACDALVEAIDLAPTFVEFSGGDPWHPRFDGRSLLPLLRGGQPADWRQVSFCEYDYSVLRVRRTLNQSIARANIVMAANQRFKLLHFPGFRPMLFDLLEDPTEVRDLGQDPAFASERDQLRDAILDWSLRPRRVTESETQIDRRTDTQVQRGIWLGLRNADDHAAALEAERRDTAARFGSHVG